MQAPVIIVHDLVQACAAVNAAAARGQRVVLRSPFTTSAAMGPGIFAELVDLARRDCPEGIASAAFDCGDEAGLALAAIRRGGVDIMIDLPPLAADSIKEMASKAGIQVIEKTAIEVSEAPVLDLGSSADAALSVTQFLENTSP